MCQNVIHKLKYFLIKYIIEKTPIIKEIWCIVIVKHPEILFDKFYTASLEGLKLIAYAIIMLLINGAVNPNANVELINWLLVIFSILFFFGILVSSSILYDLYLQLRIRIGRIFLFENSKVEYGKHYNHSKTH